MLLLHPPFIMTCCVLNSSLVLQSEYGNIAREVGRGRVALSVCFGACARARRGRALFASARFPFFRSSHSSLRLLRIFSHFEHSPLVPTEPSTLAQNEYARRDRSAFDGRRLFVQRLTCVSPGRAFLLASLSRRLVVSTGPCLRLGTRRVIAVARARH